MKDIRELCEDTNAGRECFFFEKWAEKITWIRLDEGGKPTFLLPNMDGLRFNYCPTCGAYIRDAKIEKK